MDAEGVGHLRSARSVRCVCSHAPSAGASCGWGYDVVMRLWRIVDMLMVACQDLATLRRRIVDTLDKNDCYLNSIEEVCE